MTTFNTPGILVFIHHVGLKSYSPLATILITLILHLLAENSIFPRIDEFKHFDSVLFI